MQIRNKILSEEEIGDFFGAEPLETIKWLEENEKRFNMINNQLEKQLINKDIINYLNKELNTNLLDQLTQKDPFIAIKWLSDALSVQKEFYKRDINQDQAIKKFKEISEKLITSKTEGKAIGFIGKLIEDPTKK